ncbi:MAG: signal peptide peptidase SppA, partial [Cyanobacteria bacterium REEB65]|nr:signal peptide peptidase SppA [Cyanobacteria bacterium REEB65]
PTLGADWSIVDGIHVRAQAQYDPMTADLSARLGLAIAAPTWDIGGLSGPISGSGASLQGTAGYVRYREARGSSILGMHEVSELKLEGNLGPGPSALAMFEGFGQQPAIAPTLEALRRTAEDPHLVALALTIRNVSAPLSDIEEVREAIEKVRAAGKKVVAYLPTAGFGELYLASAADRIILNPVGTLDFTGFATELQFYKGLMDKIGVRADFVKAGPYKDAMEPFERKDMSTANRDQLEALTNDQFGQILAGIAAGRQQATDDIAVEVNQGFLTAPQALDAHLVDRLGQPEDVKEVLAELKVAAAGGSNAFSRIYRIRQWAPPHIAVVTLSGAISGGSGGNDLLMGHSIGQDSIVDALRDARDDGAIKAVVLRIDSPGGDAIASEAIRNALERVAKVKPVVVSMGGEAASGGYWVACGATRLLADPGTITGSIGVFAGKFSAQGLFQKLGIQTDTVSRGKYATIDSIAHDMTPDETALMTSNMEFTYGRFLELVSRARHLPQMRVKELAGGHIWSGEAAAKLGLVDELAGLATAVTEAKEAAHVAGDVVIDYLPIQQPFPLTGDWLDVFDGTLGLSKTLARTEQWGRAQDWLLDPRLVVGGQSD